MRWLLLTLAACGAQSADAGGDYTGGPASDAAAGPLPQCITSSECPIGYTCNEFGNCEPPTTPGDAGTTPPPEVEIDLGSPISSQRYVYVAMSAENELARIDGKTLAVIATPVGAQPKVVAAIPKADGAVVLDSINGTATIVRPGLTGQPDQKKLVATLQNLNRLDIDPSGNYAVAWFALTDAHGVGSFQDVTVIALAPGNERAVDLTVGFRRATSSSPRTRPTS